MTQQFSTLVELLRWRASHEPEHLAYTFLRDGETDEAHLTYGALDEQARAIAVQLREHTQAGERVLLLYPPGLAFVTAFFGCLYADVIAVPAAPPRRHQTSRLQSIARDCDSALALTTTAFLHDLPRRDPTSSLASLSWLATDDTPKERASEWRETKPDPGALAFLQYTSGSTGQPKGVMVSHDNLLHNQRMLREAFGHSEHTVVVGWLPLFHDMGLIGNVLQPLYLGTRAVLMPPAAFLQKPSRWLHAISRYHATTSGGPNFAYDLCTRKINPEQRKHLDLSRWEVAFNGAEPIHADTIKRFTAAFEPSGFRRQAFYPCYGLAEGTLFATGGVKAEPPTLLHVDRQALAQHQVITRNPKPDTVTLVSSGRPWGQQIEIVDPAALTRSPANRVGEIWLAGPSIAQGYWNQPELTRETFHAQLDHHPQPFLRTGDLGVVHDGELYVTGRLKDTIIIRGRNHYPQDIERTVAQSHPALQAGSGAAFSVDAEGETRLVVAQEVTREYHKRLSNPEAAAEVVQAIRQAVSAEHELRAHLVVLLRPGGIPKTTSGKIQRTACRQRFLEGSLEATTVTPASNPQPLATEAPEHSQAPLELELNLRARIADALGVPPDDIAVTQELSTLGMDSLQVIELKHHIESQHGVEVTVEQFFEGLTLRTLAEHVMAGTPTPAARAAPAEPAPAVSRHAATDSARTELTAPPNGLQFSLLYFSSDASAYQNDKYELLIEGAKFADRNGFHAVWIPERHFHPFGGLYPNPSVLASALAMITRNLRLRAGSVVLPLHDPIRVAEEWAVVDNLSHGRVDLAFATGWNPRDFTLSPGNYDQRSETFHANIEAVRKLWRGEPLTRQDGNGDQQTVRIYPAPKQPELPTWITCSGGPERFAQAGAIGANVLTALLFQTEEELAEKITLYRAARAEHGFDPDAGHVTLMLHTHLGADAAEVREKVRQPFTEYLRSSVALWSQASSRLSELSARQQEDVLAAAFERYFHTAALFGTPQSTLPRVTRLQDIGVNEIACLIDFGVNTHSVLHALHPLNELKTLTRTTPRGGPPENARPTGDLNADEAQRLLANLDALSDDEVDALLGELSRDGG